MENVLNTVKSKVKTTKILAILGVVLIILGVFFNVGELKFKEEKSGGFDISSIFGMLKVESEAMLTDYWGGIVIIILAVLALALAYIGFVKSKLPEATVSKITFWDKLENAKAIWVPAILILLILILTWKTPIQNKFINSWNSSIGGMSSMMGGGDSMKLTKDDMKDDKFSDSVKYSIKPGFIIVLLGAAALIAYPIFYKPEEKVQETTPATQDTTGNE